MIQKQETTFDVVFEGRYVDGRDKAAAQAAFAQKFGDSVAGQIFSQKRAILKREVTGDAARRMQHVLAEVGMVVSLAPANDAIPPLRKSGRAASMVERAADRSRARKSLETASKSDALKEHDAVSSPKKQTSKLQTPSESKPAAWARKPGSSRWRWVKWIAVSSMLLLPVAYVAFTRPDWLPL